MPVAHARQFHAHIELTFLCAAIGQAVAGHSPQPVPSVLKVTVSVSDSFESLNRSGNHWLARGTMPEAEASLPTSILNLWPPVVGPEREKRVAPRWTFSVMLPMTAWQAMTCHTHTGRRGPNGRNHRLAPIPHVRDGNGHVRPYSSDDGQADEDERKHDERGDGGGGPEPGLHDASFTALQRDSFQKIVCGVSRMPPHDQSRRDLLLEVGLAA